MSKIKKPFILDAVYKLDGTSLIEFPGAKEYMGPYYSLYPSPAASKAYSQVLNHIKRYRSIWPNFKDVEDNSPLILSLVELKKDKISDDENSENFDIEVDNDDINSLYTFDDIYFDSRSIDSRSIDSRSIDSRSIDSESTIDDLDQEKQYLYFAYREPANQGKRKVVNTNDARVRNYQWKNRMVPFKEGMSIKEATKKYEKRRAIALKKLIYTKNFTKK